MQENNIQENNIQEFKIAFTTDSHLSLKLSKNKKDSYKESIDIMEKWIKMLEDTKADMFILLGDFFDRGSDTLDTSYNSILEEKLLLIHNIVKGNLYMLMGNHEYTFAKNNLIFKFADIQDKTVYELYRVRELLAPTMKLIKVVSNLTIANLELHFNHFHPTNKAYKINPLNPNNIIVGLYHDKIMTYQIKKDNPFFEYSSHTIDAEQTNIFNNVDVAILGDIHTPAEVATMQNDKSTKVICPGSVKLNSARETHRVTNLPIITINNLNEFKLDFYEFEVMPFEESFNVQKVEEDRTKREVTKELIEKKKLTKEVLSFNELITSIDDPIAREYLIKADNKIEPVSIKRWEEYLESNYNIISNI